VVTLKTFFEEAREGRLIGIRCLRCGKLTVPPKECCDSCHERDWAPVPLSGDGVITSFTIRPEAPHSHVSYAVALVRLNERVSLFGRLVDFPLESVMVGAEVRFRPIISGDQTLIAFGPRAS
jgi:uncharacterized OB-fold protein